MKKLTAIVDYLDGGIYDHIYANYKSYTLLWDQLTYMPKTISMII